MDTGQAVTQFLRRALDYSKLLAVPNPQADRWCVYEVRRRCSGGWEVPFQITEAGEVRRGAPAIVRLVGDFPELIYVHEIDGKYASADPHLILAELRKQDRWAGAGNVADILRRVNEARARKKAESSRVFGELADEHRGLFKKAAEEMGL